MAEAIPARHTLTFLDVGMGKGLAVMRAREFGFRKLVGAELSQSLCDTAAKNFEAYAKSTGSPLEASIVCGDFMKIELADEPTAFFLNNPFPARDRRAGGQSHRSLAGETPAARRHRLAAHGERDPPAAAPVAVVQPAHRDALLAPVGHPRVAPAVGLNDGVRLVVTTSGKKMRRDADGPAVLLAQRLGVPFVANQRGVPIQTLLSQADCVLLLSGEGVTLIDSAGSQRWSTGMAQLRIRRLDNGIDQPDHVLLAGEISTGDQVFDATMGRGHDALVLSRAVGPRGRVLAIEKSLPLYAWTSAGLAEHGPFAGACRVECERGDAIERLQRQSDASFDCVFFDPMFDKRALDDGGFDVVRRYADASQPTEALVNEARRVARRWVVVKAAPQSTLLRRLGLTLLPHRKTADLRFGRVAGYSSSAR